MASFFLRRRKQNVLFDLTHKNLIKTVYHGLLRKSERKERGKNEEKRRNGEEEMIFYLGWYLERGRQVRKRRGGGRPGEKNGRGGPAFSPAYSSKAWFPSSEPAVENTLLICVETLARSAFPDHRLWGAITSSWSCLAHYLVPHPLPRRVTPTPGPGPRRETPCSKRRTQGTAVRRQGRWVGCQDCCVHFEILIQLTLNEFSSGELGDVQLMLTFRKFALELMRLG